MRPIYSSVFAVLIGCAGQTTLQVGNDEAATGSPSGGSSNTVTQDEAGGMVETASGGVPGLSPLLTPSPICKNAVFDVPDANWPDATACAAAATGAQSAIVGTWDGYTEDEYFNPIQSYRLTLTAATSGGPICGTVEFGAGDPPPLSSDPTTWYPPVGAGYWATENPVLDHRSKPMLAGFAYTIIKGGQLDRELTISLSAYEQYRGWCGLQNAYPPNTSSYGQASGNNNFSCLPNGTTYLASADNGLDSGCYVIEPSYDTQPDWRSTPKVWASDAQCQMCAGGGFGFGTCVCDSCHCTAKIEITDTISLTFSGDTAIGKIERNNLDGQSDGIRAKLRLTRVQP